jgi:carbonic anhydrase
VRQTGRHRRRRRCGLEHLARAATGSDVVPAQPTPVWNHNSASPIGPRHWGDIGYPTCGAGMGQSPVNIDTRTGRRLNGPPLLMDNVSSELLVENTGHVVEVMILAAVTDTLRVGPDTYRLVQYHFLAAARTRGWTSIRSTRTTARSRLQVAPRACAGSSLPTEATSCRPPLSASTS